MLLPSVIFLFLCCVCTFCILHVHTKFRNIPMSWGILGKVIAVFLLCCFCFVFGLFCVLKGTTLAQWPLLKYFIIGIFASFTLIFGVFAYDLRFHFAMSTGFFVGQKIHDNTPKWFHLFLGVLVVAFVVWGGWLIVHELSQQNHYKRLQAVAYHIFQAEQAYYAEHGKYTAKMEKLEVDLPPLLQEEYRKGGYTYDNNQKVEMPDIYDAQAKNGDSFRVEIGGVGNAPDALNLPTVLEISVSGKFGTLPAFFSIYHFFGKDKPEISTFFQCNILILHDDEEAQEKDIHKGGWFCKRLGAQPTDNPLIWLF